MKVLFDVNHPAHAHQFKNVISELISENHDVIVTSREKEMTNAILEEHEIEYMNISSMGGSLITNLLLESPIRLSRLLLICQQFQPDVIVSRTNPMTAVASIVFGCRLINYQHAERDFSEGLLNKSIFKLMQFSADKVVTIEAYEPDLGPDHDKVDTYQELAYLHPNWFEPDPSTIQSHGICPEDSFVLVRFVSWDAYHDVGEGGFSPEEKEKLIKRLDEITDVYISYEGDVPDHLSKYKIPIDPTDIHHLMAFADAYIGESHVMPIEASILGTRSYIVSSIVEKNQWGVFSELSQKYGILDINPDVDEIIESVNDIDDYNDIREKIVRDKRDMTEVMLNQIKGIQ